MVSELVNNFLKIVKLEICILFLILLLDIDMPHHTPERPFATNHRKTTEFNPEFLPDVLGTRFSGLS